MENKEEKAPTIRRSSRLSSKTVCESREGKKEEVVTTYGRRKRSLADRERGGEGGEGEEEG